VLTPIVVRTLGDARYGVFMLASSLTGAYGLLDIGLRAGVNQYLTRYLSTKEYDKMNRAASSAFVVLSALGLAAAALSVVLGLNARSIFHGVPEGLDYEIFFCIAVTGVAAAVQLATFPFASVFMATQRYDILNAVGISARIFSALLIYGALLGGGNLVEVSVISAGVNVLDSLVRWRVAYRLLPELRVSPWLVDRERLGEIASFGSWAFLLSIAYSINAHGPQILVGMLLPVAAVARLALAANLVRQVGSLVQPIGQVFFPMAVELHAKEDYARLRRLHFDGSRLFLLALFPTCLIAAAWADDFYRLWIGPEYVSSDGGEVSVALLFRLLLSSMMLGYVQGIGGQLLIGVKRIQPTAITSSTAALAGLAFGAIAILNYGLVGVGAATIIANVLFLAIPLPILAARAVGATLLEYFREAILRPALAAVALLAPIALIRSSFGSPVSMVGLALQGLPAALFAVAVVVFVGLRPEERQRFVAAPSLRLAAWIRSFAQ